MTINNNNVWKMKGLLYIKIKHELRYIYNNKIQALQMKLHIKGITINYNFKFDM